MAARDGLSGAGPCPRHPRGVAIWRGHELDILTPMAANGWSLFGAARCE